MPVKLSCLPSVPDAGEGVDVPIHGTDVYQCECLLRVWGRAELVGAGPHQAPGLYGPPAPAHDAAPPHAAFHQKLPYPREARPPCSTCAPLSMSHLLCLTSPAAYISISWCAVGRTVSIASHVTAFASCKCCCKPASPTPSASSLLPMAVTRMTIWREYSGMHVILARWPVHCRASWLLPVLAPLLPHMVSRLSSKWSRMISQSGSDNGQVSAAHSEDSAAATDEVVEDRLVRELTREHLQLLLNMTNRPASSQGMATYLCTQAVHIQQHTGRTCWALSAATFPSHPVDSQQHGFAISMASPCIAGTAMPASDVQPLMHSMVQCLLGHRLHHRLCITGCDQHTVHYFAGTGKAGQSVLEWLLAEAPDLALTAVATGAAALWWPDSDSGAKATAFCRWASTQTLHVCIALLMDLNHIQTTVHVTAQQDIDCRSSPAKAECG